MNGQPSGFAGWINRMQMASFSAFAGELRTTIVLLALTAVDLWLLTSHATEILYSRAVEPLAASASVSVFLAHNTAAEQMRQIGLYLAGVIVAAVLGKSVTSLFGQKAVRTTSREYMEAKAKGEALATAEHAALPPVRVNKVIKMEVKQASEPEKEAPDSGEFHDEHQWASGDPRAGIL